MPRRIKSNGESAFVGNGKKRTSIGHSIRSRPKHKDKRRSFKKSRGQGKPG